MEVAFGAHGSETVRDFSLCATLYTRNAHGHYTKTFSGHKVIRIMLRPRDGASVLCKFSQSKCTSTFHKTFPCGNYQGTRTGRLGTSFCASLGSRNADRHVTRTILHEHLQGKGRTPRPRTSLFEQGIFYDPPSIPTAEEVPR